jgi:hypothetical protein
MPSRPPLTIAGPDLSWPTPPRKLGRHGMALWQTVQGEYSIEDPGGIELLAQACAAVDRVEALAERINADGEVLIIKGVPKPHPALREELSARSFVCRTLERLGLNYEFERSTQAVKPTGRTTRQPCRQIEPMCGDRIARA